MSSFGRTGDFEGHPQTHARIACIRSGKLIYSHAFVSRAADRGAACPEHSCKRSACIGDPGCEESSTRGRRIREGLCARRQNQKHYGMMTLFG
jgi:hypothetical protein